MRVLRPERVPQMTSYRPPLRLDSGSVFVNAATKLTFSSVPDSVMGRVDIDRIVDEQAAGIDPESPAYAETLEFLEIQRSARIDVELWVGKRGYSIQQMKLDAGFPITGSGGEQIGRASYSTVVRYSDLNEPIEIVRPLATSGEPAPGWNLVSDGPPAPAVVERKVVTSESE